MRWLIVVAVLIFLTWLAGESLPKPVGEPLRGCEREFAGDQVAIDRCRATLAGRQAIETRRERLERAAADQSSQPGASELRGHSRRHSGRYTPAK